MVKRVLATLGLLLLPALAYSQNGSVMPQEIRVWFDSTGAVCDSCTVEFYEAGTTTPLDVYSDNDLMTAVANPLTLNSAGRPPSNTPLYFSANSYKVVLKDSSGSTIYTADNIQATHAAFTGLSNTGDLVFQVDSDNNGTNAFSFLQGDDTQVAALTEGGSWQVDGNMTIGNGSATDRLYVIDGNATDFSMCLDDTLDDFFIGTGTNCGNSSGMVMNTDLQVSFGAAINGNATYQFSGTDTLASGTSGHGLVVNPVLTGASGHTTALSHFTAGGFGSGEITTQGVSETVGVVSSAYFVEPDITIGSGDTVTAAATVNIVGAPTEGQTNYALRIGDGDMYIADNIVGVPVTLQWSPTDNMAPTSNPAVADTRNDIDLLDFDDTTAESATFAAILPAHWSSASFSGDTFSVSIFWAATTATTGDVKWNAAFERGNTDLDSDSFASAQTVTDTTSGTSGILTETTIGFLGSEVDGLTAGEYFRLRITRDAADGGDTMTGDAEVARVILNFTRP